MRKIICVFCVVLCLLSLTGCAIHTDGTELLSEGTVSSVRVFSFPEYYDCFYYGVHTKPIINYLENLTLQSAVDENPDEYDSMTIEIIVTYEDGSELTLYHSGNKFIRSDDSEWYKMDYEQAAQLEELLKEKQG